MGMWLPRAERRLLAGYSYRLERPENEVWFRVAWWIPVLGCRRVAPVAKAVPEYGDEAPDEQHAATSHEQLKSEVSDLIRGSSRVEAANACLKARGLIRFSPHESERDVFSVALTVQGDSLGHKYRNWFTSSGEWFKEYREHWIWLIVGFLGGILGSLVVNWLLYGLGFGLWRGPR